VFDFVSVLLQEKTGPSTKKSVAHTLKGWYPRFLQQIGSTPRAPTFNRHHQDLITYSNQGISRNSYLPLAVPVGIPYQKWYPAGDGAASWVLGGG